MTLPALPAELEPLLTPIAAPHPGGVELRYDPLYDRIKEARREDDDVPQGEWQTERKTADWPAVVRLASDALTTKSKDLQIAAWLTEAKLRREGLAGLRAGLVLLRELVDRFWDHLYPEIDEGDAELRAAPLEWVGMRLELPVRQVKLTRDGHDYLRYRDSRLVPSEEEAAQSEVKGSQRASAIANGKLLPEVFDQSFAATGKPFYKQLVTDADGCLEALGALDERSRERFGDAAPNYQKLRETLEEMQRTAKQLLRKKLETDPDPIELEASGDGAGALVERVLDAATTASAPAAAAGPLNSRDDAASRVAEAARFLRAKHPADPAAYLLLRGFRWGELRASGASPDPRLLAAPSTETRTRLKTLLLDGKWPELLEHAETVMASAQGRGWLDLQRYVLTACDALGADYHYVGTAVRSAVRSLLNDIPGLLEMTLMDDTPTANAETRGWLRDSGLASASAGDEHASAGEPLHMRDPGALAAAEVRAGRHDRAIALLMQEIAREKTHRGRFVLQTQLARTMVEGGHLAVAMPVLEELVRHIDEHKLEEWEAGEMVAQPLALLYRCLEQLGDESEQRHALYLRICRLDPLAAIGFASAPSTG